MMKDVKLFLSEAEALGVPIDVAQAVGRLLQQACDEMGAEADLTTIIQPVERRAGTEVKAPKDGAA
jgi:3-hydroxyisobutyrate dehydrogenase-like beta-hydroxyacid dehydrogenase